MVNIEDKDNKSVTSIILRIIYYLCVVLAHFYFNHWVVELFNTPILIRLCYLTNLSFFINMIYYIIILIEHILQRRIVTKSFINSYFKFAYSISFVVFVLYWAMITINPSLLAKDGKFLPIILDLFLHGANYVLNLIEHIYLDPKEDSDYVNYKVYFIFMVFYKSMIHLVYHLAGIVVYPLVTKLNITGNIILLCSGYSLIMLGDFTYKLMMKKEYKLNSKKL